MAINHMREALDALKEKDAYTLVLYALYRLKDAPEYATLSEIAYVLDHDNLTKFLRTFGGASIKVPTIHEMNVVVKALTVYWDVDIDGKGLNASIRENSSIDAPEAEVREAYRSVKETMRGRLPEPRGED